MAIDVIHYPPASRAMLERLYDELGDLGRAVSRPMDVAELRERIGRVTALAASLLDLSESES